MKQCIVTDISKIGKVAESPINQCWHIGTLLTFVVNYFIRFFFVSFLGASEQD